MRSRRGDAGRFDGDARERTSGGVGVGAFEGPIPRARSTCTTRVTRRDVKCGADDRRGSFSPFLPYPSLRTCRPVSDHQQQSHRQPPSGSQDIGPFERLFRSSVPTGHGVARRGAIAARCAVRARRRPRGDGDDGDGRRPSARGGGHSATLPGTLRARGREWKRPSERTIQSIPPPPEFASRVPVADPR